MKLHFDQIAIKKIVEEGRLWEARDQCLSLIGRSEFDEELYSLTAQIYYAMKDFPKAGLYWMLTTDEGKAVEECISWAIRTYAKTLPDRYKKQIRRVSFPKPVMARLDANFKIAGFEEGHKALQRGFPNELIEEPKASPKASFALIGCALVSLLAPVVFLIGLFHVFRDLYQLFFQH